MAIAVSVSVVFILIMALLLYKLRRPRWLCLRLGEVAVAAADPGSVCAAEDSKPAKMLGEVGRQARGSSRGSSRGSGRCMGQGME